MKKVSLILLLSLMFISIAGFYSRSEKQQSNQSEKKMKWTKRSVVIGTRGIVATSQPLAAQAGLEILKKGGNAIDAAVATAAVLNVVEHGSTGIGGDAFVMIYMARNKKLSGLNASGRAPKNLTRQIAIDHGHRRMPSTGMLPITVPGAFDGWVTILEKYGTMNLGEVLAPAIYYAEKGFPVSEIIAGQWKNALNKLKGHPLTASTFLVDGNRPPETGELFIQKNFAETLKKLARGGRDEFYKGSIAREIVRFCQENDGYLTMEDFEKHTSTWVEPIFTDYKNYRLYELPPNGQGIAALEMLNILENVDLAAMEHNSAEYLHYLIEAKKLAYADLRQWVADPEFEDLPVDRMTSKAYGKEQFKRIDPDRAKERVSTGISGHGDTIYLTVMDEDHNAVSFINSTYEHYGSGLVGGNTGISLQNRGALFSLQEGHPNVLEPEKRPFHTIIPAMAFKDGEFFMTYGVMGGAMQPQGHVQVLLNIAEFGMDIQEAIEAARFRHYSGLRVRLEPGIGHMVRTKLAELGHDIIPHSFGAYGGGQGIIFAKKTGVMYGGSDPRKDGAAVGW